MRPYSPLFPLGEIDEDDGDDDGDDDDDDYDDDDYDDEKVDLCKHRAPSFPNGYDEMTEDGDNVDANYYDDDDNDDDDADDDNDEKVDFKDLLWGHRALSAPGRASTLARRQRNKDCIWEPGWGVGGCCLP